MNKTLLLRVRAAILAEPEKFDMSDYFKKSDSSPCGTAACIAGWSIAISKRWKRLSNGYPLYSTDTTTLGLSHWPAWLEAVKLLKINDEQAGKLFMAHAWPEPFRSSFALRKTNKHKARIAARRIDHFIATGE